MSVSQMSFSDQRLRQYLENGGSVLPADHVTDLGVPLLRHAYHQSTSRTTFFKDGFALQRAHNEAGKLLALRHGVIMYRMLKAAYYMNGTSHICNSLSTTWPHT